MAGKFGDTQNFQLVFALSSSEAFRLIERAARKCGRVRKSDPDLGIIQFSASKFLSNEVRFSVSIGEVAPGRTVVNIAASCSDGTIGLNSIGRVYDKFVTCIGKR